MGYRSQIRSPRNVGRGRETPRRARTKTKKEKHRSKDSFALEENRAPPPEEVVEKTLGRLRTLGNQVFALSPFNEYFDDWQVNLTSVLSDFEASPAISVDEQFIKECSQILSNVKRGLEEIRGTERSYDGDVKSLSDDTSLLKRIDEEYAARTREIEGRKNFEIKRLSRNVDSSKEELDRIAQTKTGIFRSISKKAKEQKVAEATQRLDSAQNELQLAKESFTSEQEKLRSEHEKRKQPIIEHIQNLRKEIDKLEIDHSLDTRRSACEALIKAMNALVQRKTLSVH